MKLSLTIVLLFCVSLTKAQTGNPYRSLKYDRIVMCDFNGYKGKDLGIVDNKGLLATTITKSNQLSVEEAKQLSAKIGLKSSYGAGTASCFDPHLGFVYYSGDKVVAHITICMDCNRLGSNLYLTAQEQGKQSNGEDVFYLSDGMSPKFRGFLNSLLRKYKFSHQVAKGRAWGKS